MNTTNLLGPMPVDAKAFAEGLNKVVAAGSAYPLGFSGKGLVMRLRMCATDECHEDEWLSAVMNQAADEIERLERENAELREVLIRARQWGVFSENFSAEQSRIISEWIDAGMKGKIPPLPDYYPKAREAKP
jgi:hypothetical protein